MAVLTINELVEIRQQTAKSPVRWTKAQINAAAQAVEDALVAAAPAISSAIDAAAAPLVLTVAEKKLLVAHVLERKFRRDT